MKKSNLEIHNEEVREIMGEIPGWVIRWGLTVIFGIIIMIIVGSYFFKYPEVITAPITLTTKNPPTPLMSKTTGNIDKVFISNEEKIEKEQIIALIENPAIFDDYQALKKILTAFDPEKNWQQIVVKKELPENLSLGDIQSSYSQFRKNWNSFSNYLKQAYLQEKIKLLENQIVKQEEYFAILLEQKLVQTEDLLLTKKNFERDSILFFKEAYSEYDFEKGKQNYLQKQSAFISFNATLKNTEASILKLKENIIELQLQNEQEIAQNKLTLNVSFQDLINNVNQWEERYLIKSPVKGTITFSKFWSENQVINAGENIATVVPDNTQKIIGKTTIPREGFGKVKVGQKVQIKLSGFPYMEFGMLFGRITSISLVPEENGYVAEIELTQGMTSNYSEELKFIQQMDGTAEIITKKMRFIYKFINPVKSFLKSK